MGLVSSVWDYVGYDVGYDNMRKFEIFSKTAKNKDLKAHVGFKWWESLSEINTFEGMGSISWPNPSPPYTIHASK